MLKTIAIAGYRSINSIALHLDKLNLVTGPNGSGKSNLYRALRLMAAIGQGELVSSIAREGGFPSVLWAGPEKPTAASLSTGLQGSYKRDKPVALKFGIGSEELSYTIDLGLPIPYTSVFMLDPLIKRECVWRGTKMSPSTMMADRRIGVVNCRDAEGAWQSIDEALPQHLSIVNEYSDPRVSPELFALRQQLNSWRFYDHFRTDQEAPSRLIQIGTRSEVLSNDGKNLAAALMTIIESGGSKELDECIADAFPGSRLVVHCDQARMQVQLEQDGMLRMLTAEELSDGTLRYILLAAALLSPKPPQLFVLNEPETSLHPDVLPALVRLIQHCSQQTQMIVVSHSATLIDLLSQDDDCKQIRLEKNFGATTVFGGNILDMPSWKWPAR